MERKFTDFTSGDIDGFKQKLLHFGKKYSNFCLLENNGYQFDKSIDCIAALGSINTLSESGINSLQDISHFQRSHKDWIFGHVAYDLKNKIESLSSNHFDGIGFPDFFFYVPESVLIISENKVSIGVSHKADAGILFKQMDRFEPNSVPFKKPVITPRFSKQEYLETVIKLQNHIAEGDCYEVCFCIEYYNGDCSIDPVETFIRLNKLSPNPFAAFYKTGNKYLLCASPERYLKRKGSEIISQPIKGTLKRSQKTTHSDLQETKLLLANEKERAENIMIVDLVRNDLAKISKRGSVHVKRYLDIHTFPQVHQMISTIAGELAPETTFGDVLTATFPMGSMTGAPKIKAMELIEKYERTRRGLFSGTVGYINPEGNFDFNVVIRSLLYNEENRFLSVQAGSAITAKSDAQKEFEECTSKIEAMFHALG